MVVEGNYFECVFQWSAPKDNQLILTFGANAGDVPFTWELVRQVSSEALVNDKIFRASKVTYRLKALHYGYFDLPPFPITLEGAINPGSIPTFKTKKILVFPKGFLPIATGLAGILVISLLARFGRKQKARKRY